MAGGVGVDDNLVPRGQGLGVKGPFRVQLAHLVEVPVGAQAAVVVAHDHPLDIPEVTGRELKGVHLTRGERKASQRFRVKGFSGSSGSRCPQGLGVLRV